MSQMRIILIQIISLIKIITNPCSHTSERFREHAWGGQGRDMVELGNGEGKEEEVLQEFDIVSFA